MNLIKTMLVQSWHSPYFRVTLIAVIASVLLIAGIVTVGPLTASADKVKVEEFSGTVWREASVTRVNEVIGDCGDADPSTDVMLRTFTGTVTYTGFMEGTGKTLAKAVRDTCTGLARSSGRYLETFESLTVAGRTGGAVTEILYRSEEVTGGSVTSGTTRTLCGTGELKSIHAEGLEIGSSTATTSSMALQLWVHFGHNHDVGYDFLCEDLGNG